VIGDWESEISAGCGLEGARGGGGGSSGDILDGEEGSGECSLMASRGF
jgi:hypothetical protein